MRIAMEEAWAIKQGGSGLNDTIKQFINKFI